MNTQQSEQPKPDADEPEVPGGPAATPNTSEGREAAIEEGEEA